MNYFIGWDVGGWHCDTNPNSRDAITIIDDQRNMVGTPWRGNLRSTINEAQTSEGFITRLFELCNVDYPALKAGNVVLAIDTPLGFSHAFVNLVVNKQFETQIKTSASNVYLYRYTERFLFEMGLKPLSPIKDMIGSQATKGMHVLAKFAPHIKCCGVWSDGAQLLALEAYPSACKGSKTVENLLRPFVLNANKQPREFVSELNHADKSDALICALVGWLQHHQPETIIQPTNEALNKEGWIFVPLDGLSLSPKNSFKSNKAPI